MARIAVLGSRPLSRRVLRVLQEGAAVEIPLVVTLPPDEDRWWEGSLWESASDLGYECVPTSEERALLEFDVDWLLSVQYPNILDAELLAHPTEGALNLHQAELPRYRGANVFNHVLLNARADDHWRHGTTLHFMTEAVDAGDIVERRIVEITEDDTAETLYERTEDVSVELLEETLPEIISGEVHELRTPQSEYNGPRYHYRSEDIEGEKRIPIEDLRDPGSELAVYDRIRAFDFPPFEPAFTVLNDRKIHLTKSRYVSSNDES